MSLTYATWLADLANLTSYDPSDANFLAILPACIDDSEQRIYRELDLLNTVTRDTGTFTVGTRTFTLPSNLGRFVVTNGFNVVTPSSTTNPDADSWVAEFISWWINWETGYPIQERSGIIRYFLRPPNRFARN